MCALQMSSNRFGFPYRNMQLKPNYHHDNRHFSLINNMDVKELNTCKTFDYIKQSHPQTCYSNCTNSSNNMSGYQTVKEDKLSPPVGEIEMTGKSKDELPAKNGGHKSRKRKRNRKRKRKHQNRKTKPTEVDDPTTPLIAQLCAIGIDSCDVVDGCCPWDNLRPNTAIAHRFGTRISSDCESEDSFIMFGDENVCSRLRPRLQSDCVSEDSFIVFDTAADSTVLDSSIDDCDEVPRKKVRFASEENLCEIHPMIQWSYAYHKARKGPWEQFALDRMRFKNRVCKLQPILDPILATWHRNKIYAERFEESS